MAPPRRRPPRRTSPRGTPNAPVHAVHAAGRRPAAARPPTPPRLSLARYYAVADAQGVTDLAERPPRRRRRPHVPDRGRPPHRLRKAGQAAEAAAQDEEAADEPGSRGAARPARRPFPGCSATLTASVRDRGTARPASPSEPTEEDGEDEYLAGPRAWRRPDRTVEALIAAAPGLGELAVQQSTAHCCRAGFDPLCPSVPSCPQPPPLPRHATRINPTYLASHAEGGPEDLTDLPGRLHLHRPRPPQRRSHPQTPTGNRSCQLYSHPPTTRSPVTALSIPGQHAALLGELRDQSEVARPAATSPWTPGARWSRPRSPKRSAPCSRPADPAARHGRGDLVARPADDPRTTPRASR